MRKKSQDLFRICFICGEKIKGKLLCKKCKMNPFPVEDARKKAIELGELKIFSQLYSKDFSEIKNINTKEFWNKKFEEEIAFDNQDLMTKEKIDKIISLIPNKTIKILDLGFGQGYFEERLQKKRKSINIYGIDISTSAVSRANKKFRGAFISGDILNIKKIYKESSFDIVVAIEIIEHISPKKILQFFSDINFLLKHKGILIVSTPLNEHLRRKKENPSGHVRDYSSELVEAELSLSGFHSFETYTFHAFRNHYFLKKLLSKVFRKRWEVNNVVIKAVKP